MANTINDLYLKYANKVGRSLENDRYFQYLFEMVQAGSNELVQNRRILHKVVDERWLSTIEEALDSINTIIEKPRRFVTTAEEVVPVDLAKRITADSVRHLSMNTQFIASNENGDVHPTRILNVTTEETYDLYENRFIYHLIQRLVTFIDKRTDIIFWSTGDEKTNTMTYTSKVDDAYEEIQYKIEMTVKNRQSFAENDADNMSVFMRIDRVRRLVMALRNSSFCSIMAGCAKVRSPIQRTNLIMKDPHYRNCYKLWQFLESYDEVGYTIEEEDTALEFDEEYLIQMYTGLITNYSVFKSILEGDERNLDKVMGKKRRTIKPKFIKKYQEEIVDDRNIEEVEIRRVFLEEVTQAQLDAEAKLAEALEKKAVLEQELEDLDSQMIMLQQQINALNFQISDANMALAEERDAKEDLELKLGEETEMRTALEEEVQNLNGEKSSLEDTIVRKDDENAALTQKLGEANDALSEAIRLGEELKVTVEAEKAARVRSEEEAKQTVEKTAQDAADRIQAAEKDAAERILAAENDASDRIQTAEQKAAAEIQAIQSASGEEIAATKLAAAEEVQRIQTESAQEIETIKSEAEQEIARTKADAEEKVREANDTMMQARRRAAEAVTQVEQESKEREEKLRALMEQQLAEVQAQAEETLAVTKAEAEATLTASKAEAANTLQTAVAEKDREIEGLREEARLTLEDTVAKAEAQMAEIRAKTDTEVARIRTEADAQIAQTKTESDAAIAQIKSESEAAIAKTIAEADDKMALTKAEAAQQIASNNTAAQDRIEAVRAESRAEVDKMRAQALQANDEKTVVEQLLGETQQKLAAAEERADNAEAKVKETEEALAKAEARAEARTLSHYIVNALNERNGRKRKDE